MFPSIHPRGGSRSSLLLIPSNSTSTYLLPNNKHKTTNKTKITKKSYICLGQEMGKVGKLTQIKYVVMYLPSVLQTPGRTCKCRNQPPSQTHTACYPHSREGRERSIYAQGHTLKILSQIANDTLNQENSSAGLSAAFCRVDLCFPPPLPNSLCPLESWPVLFL